MELLLWLVLAPAALFYTLRKVRGGFRWGSLVDNVYLFGSSISWVLLIWAQEFSFAAFFIANLSILFIFLHTVGFFEAYMTPERRTDSSHNIEMYLFHVVAIVGINLASLNIGRGVSCKVAKFTQVATNTCQGYSEQVLWIAILIQVLTVIFIQARNFFGSAMIPNDDGLSRAIMYKRDHEIVYGFYLLALLLVGWFW